MHPAFFPAGLRETDRAAIPHMLAKSGHLQCIMIIHKA